MGNRTLSKKRHAEKFAPVDVSKSFVGQAGVSLFDDSNIAGMKINQSKTPHLKKSIKKALSVNRSIRRLEREAMSIFQAQQNQISNFNKNSAT